jgi:Ni,Fe-hydrogenase III large subunit
MTVAATWDERAAVRLIRAEPRELQSRLADLVDAGARAEGLFAAGRPGAAEVRCVLATHDGPVIVQADAAGALPSPAELVPALDWDEREARDLYGVRFDGRAHRALVAHPDDPAEWMTTVVGDDVHQVAVGPIHAGVIESGHFRFHTVGERILHLDTRLFYKHRGLESAAQGRAPADALAVVGRACAGCAVANALAYAQAVEAAQGLWPDDRLRRARTLLLELERLYNHVNDIGQICAGVGLAPGAMVFAGFKERAQRMISALAGHRFMFGAVSVGGSRLEVPAAVAARARADLAAMAGEVRDAWRDLLFSASLRDRTRGTGTLTAADARALGAVGPAARASGLPDDARQQAGRLWYPGFAAAAPEQADGDVAARMEARAVELPATFAILDELLAEPVRPAGVRADGVASAHGVGRVESARGRTWCAVELRGGVVARVHLRTGSYANWPSVARSAVGAILPDFPLVNKSFELCYACADR